VPLDALVERYVTLAYTLLGYRRRTPLARAHAGRAVGDPALTDVAVDAAIDPAVDAAVKAVIDTTGTRE